MSTSPALSARSVSKAFFGNPVLRAVSIALVPGRIHALLGENGAGKSTLINILSGALAPDDGAVEAGGAARVMTPALARAAGIAVVQQELSLAANLSIAENIGLGAYPRRRGLVDYRALAARAAEVCAEVGLDEPLWRPVHELSLGRRQMVEIAKALFRRPRVLILDEPTSSLSATEAATLFGLMRRLRDDGVALLFISHRLPEVMAISDHVTILKDGSVSADQPLAGTDAAALVRLMVGRDPGDLFPAKPLPREGEVALSVRGFAAGAMRDVDLDLRKGEILGIGGLVGQGQEDLLLGLYGALPASARQAVPGLVAYVPADRKREGLHLSHSIRNNLLLPLLARLPALSRRSAKTERTVSSSLAAQFAIKGDLGRAAQALSGGNQQKVALAKWLPHRPGVLLLNDPTRGVDIETKREIYVLLRQLAAEATAIVLLSSDTPELVHLADRVAVVRDGRIVALLEGLEVGEAAIVAAAIGAGGAA
jgi:ribose transport system ATP-binding protein